MKNRFLILCEDRSKFSRWPVWDVSHYRLCDCLAISAESSRRRSIHTRLPFQGSHVRRRRKGSPVRSSRRQADSKYWRLGPPQSGGKFLERRGRECEYRPCECETRAQPPPPRTAWTREIRDAEKWAKLPLWRVWEGGGSHSKCVFTSDRVMTNNGVLLDGSFRGSTQHDVREKRSGMTDDHRVRPSSPGQHGEKRREAQFKEQVADLGQSATATSWISCEWRRSPSIPGTWTCFLFFRSYLLFRPSSSSSSSSSSCPLPWLIEERTTEKRKKKNEEKTSSRGKRKAVLLGSGGPG